MSTSSRISELLMTNQFLGADPLDDSITQILMENAALITLPEQGVAVKYGSICEQFVLVIDGSIRVRLLTNTGRDVTLYHVHPGEACALTLSCMLSGEPFPAEAIAESEVVALSLPAADFDRAMQESHSFRSLVRKKFAQRLAKIIGRIEQICSPAIDCQLARVLLETNKDEAQITVTHQELATELGTAREVVSRHLKHFESNGWIKLNRGKIDIINPKALKNICEETNQGNSH